MTGNKIGPDTKRLRHRAYEIDDAPAFYELNRNPEVMRYTGEEPVASLEDARQAIQNYRDFDEIGFGRWACIHKQSEQAIGFCGLKFLPELGEVDLGYRFLPQYWGQGFATEASIASLQFGFERLQLEKVIGLVLPANVGSIRVLEKVGMNLDGEVIYDGIQVLRYTIDRQQHETQAAT